MRLLHNKLFAVTYWLAAFAATIFAAVVGTGWAREGAPKFGGDSGAGAGSEILFAVGGAALGIAVALAVFAGVWLGMWANERRLQPPVDDGDYASLDDLGEGFVDDDDSFAAHDFVSPDDELSHSEARL